MHRDHKDFKVLWVLQGQRDLQAPRVRQVLKEHKALQARLARQVPPQLSRARKELQDRKGRRDPRQQFLDRQGPLVHKELKDQLQPSQDPLGRKAHLAQPEAQGQPEGQVLQGLKVHKARLAL